MIKFFYFLCSLFILSGCTLFFGERNEDIFTTNNITPTKVPEALYCPKKQSITVLSETKSAGQDFIKFIKKVESNHSLSFIDKTILWTLIQFNLRPDKSSPQAKLQILLTINGKESFYNGQVSNKGPATFYTLKRLLKKYNSRYSLQSLASFIDKYYLNSFYVSNTFENFLQIHKDSIAQNPVLKKIYMRGDETLRENERIPKLNYTSLFKNVKRNKNFKLISKLFKINQNTLLETKCNFDINVYEKSWYHIAPQKLQAHTFGLQEGKNRFMAMSSLSFSKLEVYQKTHLFSGSSEMQLRCHMFL